MKGIRPFRFVVLTVATCAAAMLWIPVLVTVAVRRWSWIDPFTTMGKAWWLIQLICCVLTVALTVVAVMRRDFVSIFGFASGLSVFFGAPILLMVIFQVF